jgi:hypothetical protein
LKGLVSREFALGPKQLLIPLLSPANKACLFIGPAPEFRIAPREQVFGDGLFFRHRLRKRALSNESSRGEHMIAKHLRWLTAGVLAFNLALLPAAGTPAGHNSGKRDDFGTATPIKHVVVIFQENVSFDHYFATYPHAKPNKNGTSYFPSQKY